MRYFVLASLLFSLMACTPSKDARYYRLHPQALQEALKNCPQSHPKHIACPELVMVADEVNTLAYQLQRDPQGFGNTILKAQAKLAHLLARAIKNDKSSALHAQIVRDKQKIAEYLSIVRWLESPQK